MPEIKHLNIDDDSSVDMKQFVKKSSEPTVATASSTPSALRLNLSPRTKKILATVLGLLLVFLVIGGVLGFYTFQTTQTTLPWF